MLFYHGQKSCRMNAENYAADDVSGVSLWRGGWFDVYEISVISCIMELHRDAMKGS